MTLLSSVCLKPWTTRKYEINPIFRCPAQHDPLQGSFLNRIATSRRRSWPLTCFRDRPSASGPGRLFTRMPLSFRNADVLVQFVGNLMVRARSPLSGYVNYVPRGYTARYTSTFIRIFGLIYLSRRTRWDPDDRSRPLVRRRVYPPPKAWVNSLRSVSLARFAHPMSKTDCCFSWSILASCRSQAPRGNGGRWNGAFVLDGTVMFEVRTLRCIESSHE